MPGQCSECSAEFTDDASACSACGAPLSTAKTLPQESTERRLLSIVFADLVGSTRLSQTLDLEDYNDLLRAYEKACAAVVERWGSEIVQQYGDGILFYLGYPVSHEDDARRAVGAAFEIAQVAPQIRIPASARSLEVRVGVHTGMTVIEAVGSAERRVHLARGAVPNLASRIQALAAPNTVVISESTRALIQGYWECEPLNQHFDGLQLYRVVAATGAARSIDAAAAVGLTQFVGRADEVAALQKSWSRSIEGATDAVLVMGEAGIGKSRLVQVLKAHVARGPARVVEWSCSRDAQATALRPVAEAVARQVGITDGSASEERLTKLQHGMAALGSFKQDAVWLMASLLSIPVGDLRGPPDTTPQGIRKRTLETLLEILKAFCSREALLLVIEDVHWADPSTLELVGLVLERLRGDRVLVVITARPEFSSPWDAAITPTKLSLSGLASADAQSMIRDVAGGRNVPSEVVEELAERSEGVPLFVEELTRAVLESDVLADRGDRYELVRPLEGAHIPSSIQASLMARFDRLGRSKRVAQVGSVLGRTFGYDMIRAVDDATDAQLEQDLRELVRADLLHVTGEAKSAQWTFKHALIRDAAYDSLLRKVRRQLHKRIARVLVERFPETAHVQPEVVADHFTQAGAVDEAVPHWIAAAQQAVGRSANQEAVDCLKRGLKVVEQLAEGEERANAELTMRGLLGPPMMAIEGFSHPDVLFNYTRAHELVKQVGAGPQMFDVLWGLWANDFVAGQLRAARAPAEQVVRMARDDARRIPPAHNALGYVECYTAHYPETLKLVEEGRAAFDFDQERRNCVSYQFSSTLALCNMGATAYWLMGKPNEARTLAAEAKRLAERLGHPPSTAFAMASSAWLVQLSGDAAEVLEIVRVVNRLSEEGGFALWPPLVSVFGGWATMVNGDVEQGVAIMLDGFRRYRAIGGGILRTHGFALLAEGLLRAGRIGESLTQIDEAVENAHTTGEVHFEPELYRIQGLALADRAGQGSSLDDAFAALERARGLAREQQAHWLELRAALDMARLLRAQGDATRARQTLEPVHAALGEAADTREMQAASALLAELKAT